MAMLLRPVLPTAVVILVTIISSPVSAQPPQWSFPTSRPVVAAGTALPQFGGTPTATLSASGRYVALVSGLRLQIYDIQTDTWESVSGRDLIAPLYPGIPASCLADPMCIWPLEGTTLNDLVAEVSLVGISDDGRYVGFAVRSVVARYDRATGSVDELNRLGSYYSRLARLSMSRDGQSFSWATLTELPGLRGYWNLTVRRVGESPVFAAVIRHATPALSADGSHVAYVPFDGFSGAYPVDRVAVHRLDDQAHADDREFRLPWVPEAVGGSGDLTFLVLATASDGRGLLDTVTGILDPMTVPGAGLSPVAVSDDGRVVLARRPRGDGTESVFYDPVSGLAMPLGTDQVPLALTSDGTRALTYGPIGAGQSGLALWSLDADADGMFDGWETLFGLDPTDPTDAATDLDGDGASNLAAFEARLHPNAMPAATRHFAEGARGFFDTQVSLFNPGGTRAAVVLHLLGPAGERTTRVMPLEALSRADLRIADVVQFVPDEFSMVIESDAPIVTDRRMSWSAFYRWGMHGSTAAEGAASTWYFAEGATIGGLQTFFLLQNPGELPADVTIRYLRQGAGAKERAYTIGPHSRLTVWANQEGPDLAASEFAAVVASTQPIVAERAMYRDAAGQMFSAGTNAAGVTAPALEWTFAEGAIGDFFDTFVLVANPGTVAAQVTAEFRPEGAPAFERTFSVPPDGRYTLWVDHVGVSPPATAVSVTLRASAPVVAERAMWWPGSSATWSEGHVEFGAMERGVRFAIADGELDSAAGTDTFLLVDADTGGTPAAVRLLAYPTEGPPLVRVIPVSNGRNTLWMASLLPELDGQHFAVVVEAVDRPEGVPHIAVERALYRGGLRSGLAARAARLN